MTVADYISENVVVTGASSGIGLAIAKRLQEDGWNIFNLDIQSPKDDTVGIWLETDLSDADCVRNALGQVLSQGGVSGLVNNAAIPGDMELLVDTTDLDMDQVYAVNMKAPMICARQLAPAMKAQGFGRIVNISSRAQLGKSNRTSYGGTKGAVVSMTRCWAIELASAGITCNVVAPGPVRTKLFDVANPDYLPRTRRIINAIPVGRIGETEDIGQAVSFFMDRRSGYVTGQLLYVCGGVTLTRGGS